MNPHVPVCDVVLDTLAVMAWNVVDPEAAPVRPTEADFSWDLDGDVVRDLMARAS